MANAPFDAYGNPQASSAQGGNPDPASGKIKNRYDRLVEGGRSSISKIASVPLPADVVALKSGAFGEKAVTGLDPGLVNPTQEKGSLQTPEVTIPAYVDSKGKTVAAQKKTNTSDYGIFVNTKSSKTEVAGGVVVPMALGGVLSLSDRRFRVAAGARRTTPVAVAAE